MENLNYRSYSIGTLKNNWSCIDDGFIPLNKKHHFKHDILKNYYASKTHRSLKNSSYKQYTLKIISLQKQYTLKIHAITEQNH